MGVHEHLYILNGVGKSVSQGVKQTFYHHPDQLGLFLVNLAIQSWVLSRHWRCILRVQYEPLNINYS